MKVLIIGRSNVGKSSIFNRIVRKRSSLVFDEDGITRDVLKSDATWWGHTFELIDSGGMPEETNKQELQLQVKQKIDDAIEESDIFIIVTDGKAGLHPGDKSLLRMIQKTSKPFTLFVNKIDNPIKRDDDKLEFFAISDQLIAGSAEQEYGIDELIEWIISHKEKRAELESDSADQDEEESITSLFVVGKANSGKSMLCNQVLDQERMIVNSQPGTTLDTITEFFSKDEESFAISDNPGSRRGNREEREKISYAKSRANLHKHDIVLLVIDGVYGPTRQDAKLVQLCLEKRKPILVVINKMDLLKSLDEYEREQKEIQIDRIFHFCEDLPIVFISAKTGYHKEKLFKAVAHIKEKIHFKISTSELNQFFTNVIKRAPAPVYGNSDVKFYYITQTHKRPPDFVAFANYPKGVTPSYRRFVINQMKRNWGLEGIPIGLHILPRRQ